jgi:putative transcription factor
VESEKRSNTEQRGNRQTYDSTPHGAAAAKIADETENFHHDRVPTEIRTRIIKARNDKKMTQAQLAMAACLQPRVIQEYERGKAIPDGATLSKLARALGVPTLKNRIVPDSI